MKYSCLLPLLFAFFGTFAQTKPAYLLYKSNGKRTDWGEIRKATKEIDMVFFGELHNNPIAHWLELELLSDLYDLYGDKLIAGAEMFEADGQLILNEYLKDIITEKNFEAEMRLWDNYKTDYKPLINLAKAKKIPFIATNVPRRYASIVNKQGIDALDKLEEKAKAYLAPLPLKINMEQPSYQEMLTMMGGHGNENIVRAQALKDATMAHFILQHWSVGKIFLHFNGSFHSDLKEGIITFIKQKQNDAHILTITVIESETMEPPTEAELQKADFIILIPAAMTKTH
jgi:uncharacterized iron-regulated protein